jgi:hypothetical protein
MDERDLGQHESVDGAPVDTEAGLETFWEPLANAIMVRPHLVVKG